MQVRNIWLPGRSDTCFLCVILKRTILIPAKTAVGAWTTFPVFPNNSASSCGTRHKVQTLCRRTDVDTIINAGDADREGEIIVRLCITHALTPEERLQKQMRRLWLPDQTPQTICQALQELPNDDAYDALANEGFARTYIDWLWGVNLTRYATLRTGHFLRVGRVIVPIVKAIYDRDMAIRHFQIPIFLCDPLRRPMGKPSNCSPG